MSISVLARAERGRDLLVTDKQGRVLYWRDGQGSKAYAYAEKKAIKPPIVYVAQSMEHMADRLGVSVADLVAADSLN